MRTGETNVPGPFKVPGRCQPIRVYLLQGYNPAEPTRPLPVRRPERLRRRSLLLQWWYLHEAVEGLAKSRRPVPVVIGIEHGTKFGVNLELSFPFESDAGPDRHPPRPGERPPDPGPDCRAQPGAAAAGDGDRRLLDGGDWRSLVALPLPGAFGGALVMSPSFWVANQAIFVDIAAQFHTLRSVRIYLDAGSGGQRQGRRSRQEDGRAPRRARLRPDRLMWRADPSVNPQRRPPGDGGCRRRCGSCTGDRDPSRDHPSAVFPTALSARSGRMLCEVGACVLFVTRIRPVCRQKGTPAGRGEVLSQRGGNDHLPKLVHPVRFFERQYRKGPTGSRPTASG